MNQTPSESCKEREIQENILSSLDVCYPTLRDFPCLDELSQFLSKTCSTLECNEILQYVKNRQSELPSLVKELQSLCVEKNPSLILERENEFGIDKYYGFILKLLARGEVERVSERRLGLREYKQREIRDANGITPLRGYTDSNGNMERSLELIECLPSASRGVEPPRLCFVEASRKLHGNLADANEILECALLMEEHALDLLKEYMPKEKIDHVGLITPWVQPYEINSEGIARLQVVDQMRCARIIHEIFKRDGKNVRKTGLSSKQLDKTDSSGSEYELSQDGVEDSCVEEGDK